jgi:hypothetical protein
MLLMFTISSEFQMCIVVGLILKKLVYAIDLINEQNSDMIFRLLDRSGTKNT